MVNAKVNDKMIASQIIKRTLPLHIFQALIETPPEGLPYFCLKVQRTERV